ncbi:MAG: TIGR02597 family protein [Chthoniobacteraceae bacterium]
MPVGLVHLNIAAGTGSSPTLSVLSFPLLNDASITGQSAGIISSITSNSITNSGAGWTAGALSTAASPYIIQITSGSATGRSFLISTSTANTATTVTVDAQESTQVNLTTLGIATGTSGDTYSIYECDTLLSIFGAGSAMASGTAVLGATSSDAADSVQLFVSGAWRQYYYNTATGNWKRVGPDTVSDNVPIRPDTGIIYSRLPASALNLAITGHVPSVDRQAIVANSGVTFVSSAWPTDSTLGSSNIASISGWVASSSSSGADMVQMLISGAWRQYYYDGTNWRRVGPDTVSDSVAVPMGTAAILQKSGTAAGVTTLVQTIPYAL